MIQNDDILTMAVVEQFAGFRAISQETPAFAAFRAAVMKGPVEKIEFLGGPRHGRDPERVPLHPSQFSKSEYETWKRNLSKVVMLKYTFQRIPEALLDPCIEGGALRVLKFRLFRDEDAQTYAIRCANRCPHLQCIVIEGGCASAECLFFAFFS
jgi:hypothetical protein